MAPPLLIAGKLRYWSSSPKTRRLHGDFRMIISERNRNSFSERILGVGLVVCGSRGGGETGFGKYDVVIVIRRTLKREAATRMKMSTRINFRLVRPIVNEDFRRDEGGFWR